ncbi:dehydrase and lipid transport-domain-containing protein [Calycina marina]|uniref:Dehydrase and lipid transport-domain-containing protein n=1 Tax=Calycina marina TaxID=1763456 RepID=A0A9P7Z1H2_9HELO|nr:dehydrase and lipid transport-domain-containing protein [Calycina marina]
MSVKSIGSRAFRASQAHGLPLKYCHNCRSFLTLPGTEAQTLKASRILPYKASSIYSLIADVDAYSNFVPYCVDSKVTKWSTPDEKGTRWPLEADLKVGWGGYEEIFTSRLYCVPNSTVEALSGEAVTSLPTSKLQHYSASLKSLNSSPTNNIFKSLSTRWNFMPVPTRYEAGMINSPESPTQTEVHLTIDFQFANPIYAALSNAAAPRVAGIMIEAFEAQAKRQLDK